MTKGLGPPISDFGTSFKNVLLPTCCKPLSPYCFVDRGCHTVNSIQHPTVRAPRNGNNKKMLPYAPGARVVIRDEEWLVRRVDPSNDGGHLLSCDGVSEVVRGRSVPFLTELEDEIIV